MNETKRGHWWRIWYVWETFWTDGEFAEDDEFGYEYQEEHSAYFNEKPYPPQHGTHHRPTSGYREWTQRFHWRARWRWTGGRQVPHKVVNEMAGYRDPAVVEIHPDAVAYAKQPPTFDEFGQDEDGLDWEAT